MIRMMQEDQKLDGSTMNEIGLIDTKVHAGSDHDSTDSTALTTKIR